MKKEHYVIFISKKSAIFAPTNPNGWICLSENHCKIDWFLSKKCTGGYLFSIISVNTGNLKIIQKNYEYND